MNKLTFSVTDSLPKLSGREWQLLLAEAVNQKLMSEKIAARFAACRKGWANCDGVFCPRCSQRRIRTLIDKLQHGIDSPGVGVLVIEREACVEPTFNDGLV